MNANLSITEHAARRRQAKEERLDQLVAQAHSWSQADLDEAADLAIQLGKDPAEIDQRCNANRQAHADQQQQERLKAEWIRAAEALAKAKHRHDALTLVDDPMQTWERAAIASFARPHADATALVFRDRNQVMDAYLRVGGWANRTVGGWFKDRRSPVQLVAVHEQFTEDLVPVIAALEALAAPVPDTVAPENVEPADIEAANKKLSEIPPVDPTIERYITIVTAAKLLYIDGHPDSLYRAKVAGEMNQALEPFRQRFAEYLREMQWAKLQTALA